MPRCHGLSGLKSSTCTEPLGPVMDRDGVALGPWGTGWLSQESRDSKEISWFIYGLIRDKTGRIWLSSGLFMENMGIS